MTGFRLPAFYQPAEDYSERNADRDGRNDGFNGMPLQALGGFIKDLFGSVAALFGDSPGCLYPVFHYIGDDTRHARSLSRCFGDLLAGLTQH
jgi:hypothetical protein